MDFEELLHDIEKLEGLRLSSIRPGAEITVEKVDIDQGKIMVRNSSGKVFNRSISEFQRIWEGLVSEPAVRVEEVLRGSGSSRNQPETIFANLPYIEWLKVNNKKHIALVAKSSHPYGTKKEMDGFAASTIKDLLSVPESSEIITIVSTYDLHKSSSVISTMSGIMPLPLNDGTYLFSRNGKSIALIDANKCKIPEGTYGLVYGSQKAGCSYSIKLNGAKYGIVKNGSVNVFFLMRD